MKGRHGALDRFLGWFPRHARVVLAATLVLTALAAASVVDLRTGRPRLEVDPSSDRLLPEDDEARLFFDHVRRVFGSDEPLIVAWAGEDAFTPGALEAVSRMTGRIAALDGVDRVVSLTNAVGVRAEAGDVVIGPFVEGVLRDPAALEALRRDVQGDPLYGGSLVSRDGRVTAVLVYFLEMSSREFLERGLDAAVTRIAEEEAGGGEVWVTGGPHIRAETARILLGETTALSLGILAVLAGVLLLSFRTARGVLLPLATIVVAVSWTLAVVAWIGEPLNAVTSLVPPLLTALGLSYSVHVVSEYYEVGREDADAAPVERVARAARAVALPVGLTGLTTAAGFASLGLSPIAAVRDFGWLLVLGVAFTVAASLSFTPAVLAVLPAPRRLPPASGGRRSATFDRLAEGLARFDVRHRRAIFAASAGVFALAIAGATQLRIGTQTIGKFPPTSRVRLDFEAVNAHLGGANPLYVVVESETPDAFKEPANLRALQSLEAWLAEQPEVGATTSLVDAVKLVNRGFHDDDPAHAVIPESRRLVSQLLFFGGGEYLDRFVDSRYQTASIHVRARVIDSDRVVGLVDRIEGHLASLPAGLSARVTGTGPVLASALDDVMRGQAQSIVAAFGIIYLILAAMFVSWRTGLVALVPNVLPVAAYFGALGAFGIRLDPGTSLVAPMVLGIAVDDTIHYFSRFIGEVRRTADEERATVAALKAVGRPVTYTSLALCGGFLVLTASELQSQVELGAMAAFALAFAWLTDFTLTPALCARLRIATLWDLLTVDLGPDAHHQIRLLQGLRASQARMVALLSSVVTVRAGEWLFREGEPGESVYAVIDGRLRATARHAGGRLELETLARGDAVGEVGLLQMARSTDVRAEEDARLLRLTQDSIDQLARRSPRIAAVLYRNLSAVAAERLVRATAGLRRAADGPGADAAAPGDGETRPAVLDAHAATLAEAFFGAAGEGTVGAGPEMGDPRVLGILAPLALPAGATAALGLVPLAWVAWADGRVDRRERDAVLGAAREAGLTAGGAGHRALLAWLDRGPSPALLEAWEALARDLGAALSVESRLRLAETVARDARNVAEAAGGVLGLGSVSRVEEGVVSAVAAAFEPEAGDAG